MCIFEDILCNSAGVLDEWCFTFVVSFLVVLTGTGLNLQLWVVVLFKYDDFTDVGDFFGQLPYDGGFLSGHTLLRWFIKSTDSILAWVRRLSSAGPHPKIFQKSLWQLVEVSIGPFLTKR